MTVRTVTVQVKFLKFGDAWQGQTVTGLALASGSRAGYVDITMHNADTGVDTVYTRHQDQWFAVLRDA
jgi:hypothetical protein